MANNQYRRRNPNQRTTHSLSMDRLRHPYWSTHPHPPSYPGAIRQLSNLHTRIHLRDIFAASIIEWRSVSLSCWNVHLAAGGRWSGHGGWSLSVGPRGGGGGRAGQGRYRTPPPRSVLASLHGSRAVLGWHDRPPDPLIVHCYPSFAATSLQITNPQTALCLSPRLDPARGRANTEAISLTSSLPLSYHITDFSSFLWILLPLPYSHDTAMSLIDNLSESIKWSLRPPHNNNIARNMIFLNTLRIGEMTNPIDRN